MTVDRREWLPIAVAMFGFVIFSAQLARLFGMRVTERTVRPPSAPLLAPPRFPEGTGQRIVDGAVKAGVDRLASLDIRGTARETIRAEWLGSAASALSLIASTESHGLSVQRLQVAAQSRASRWTLTGRPAFSLGVEESPPTLLHDPWPSPVATSSGPAVAVRARLRKSDRMKKTREARERAAAEKIAQAHRLEERRSDIMAGVSVSATMSNGREPLALAEVMEGGRRNTVTLRRGDSVLGATVGRIDDRTGVVEIQIDEKNRVELRVPGAGAP